jgi:hypothetical protein
MTLTLWLNLKGFLRSVVDLASKCVRLLHQIHPAWWSTIKQGASDARTEHIRYCHTSEQ